MKKPRYEIQVIDDKSRLDKYEPSILLSFLSVKHKKETIETAKDLNENTIFKELRYRVYDNKDKKVIYSIRKRVK